MNQVKSIFRNTGWMSFSQVVISACAFLYTILIARYLGVSDYGNLSFAISFTILMGVIIDLGMHTYITREIAKNKDLLDKTVNNIFFFKIFLAFVLFFISWFILILMGCSHSTIIVTLIFTIEVVFMSMAGFINAIFQAFEDLKYQSIGGILNNGLLLLCILLIIYWDLGILAVAFSYTLGYFIFFAYMFFKYVQKFKLPKFEIDLLFIKNIVLGSLPFCLTNFFYLIYFSIDVVMLSYLSGDYAAGLYKSAYNIIIVFTAFFAVYQSSIFPVMSKFFKESQNLIKKSYELSIKYLLLILLPLCIFVFLYARPLIDLIYSSQYSLAASAVKILIWAVVILFVNGAASTLLNAIDKEIVVTKVYIGAAIFNVVINFILIPILSYDGAAMATVLSEIFIFVLFILEIFKTEYKPDFELLGIVLKLVFANTILFLALYLLNATFWIAIPLTCIIYAFTLFLTRIIDDDDKYIFNELLK